MNPPSRTGVGLALVAMPRLSVAERLVGERRPYIPLRPWLSTALYLPLPAL